MFFPLECIRQPTRASPNHHTRSRMQIDNHADDDKTDCLPIFVEGMPSDSLLAHL